MKSTRKIVMVCAKCGRTENIYITVESNIRYTDDTLFEAICPHCGEIMFECDEDIVEDIIALNKTGKVKTLFCCSGHAETYISKDTHQYIYSWSDPYVLMKATDDKELGNISTKIKELINDKYPLVTIYIDQYDTGTIRDYKKIMCIKITIKYKDYNYREDILTFYKAKEEFFKLLDDLIDYLK